MNFRNANLFNYLLLLLQELIRIDFDLLDLRLRLNRRSLWSWVAFGLLVTTL